MSHKAAVAIFGFGMLCLMVALLVPGMVGSVEEDVSSTHSIATPNGSTDVTDNMELRLVNVTDQGSDPLSGTAEWEVVNTRDYTRASHNVTVDVSQDFDVNGETVTVTTTYLSEDEANALLTYDSTFGWDSGPSTLVDHLGTLLVLVGALSLIMSLAMAVEIK